MVFTFASIMAAVSGTLTTVATVNKAYTTVKEIKQGMEIDLPEGVIDQAGQLFKGGRKLSKNEINAIKRDTAIRILEEYLLPKLEKRGGKPDDMGVLVDFSCVVYRLIRGKKS